MTSDAMAIAWQVHRSADPSVRASADWPELARAETAPPLHARVPTGRLIDLLSQLRGPEDATLCLRAGIECGSEPFDALWLLLRASPDVAALLDHATRYWPTWTTTSNVQRRTRGEGLSLELEPTWRNGLGLARLHHFLAGALIGALGRSVGRWPTRLELPGTRPDCEAPIADGMLVPVQHGVDRARIHYASLPLETALRSADGPIERFLERSLVRTVADLEQTMSARLDALIQERLASGVSMESAAVALGLSERTLRRRLGEEGTSYRERLDTVRRAYALTHLASRSVAEVADALGFMDVRSFQRAFRRWTSMSPLEFRSSLSPSE